MVKRISLRQLQREVAIERSKARKLEQRQRLEAQLKQLRTSGRSDVPGRIKRGFVILARKAGGAVVKQARLIRQRQIEETKRTNKRRRRSLTGRDNRFAPLDF